ncbi:MAG TPA: GNAT family N-acetyltransferase [Stellaceae bacterium]|nr:GNAT family N-acetyltransferase [Stellaceae bacterium]
MSIVLQPARAVDLSRLALLHALCFPDDAWSSSALATVLAMPGADGRVLCGQDGALYGVLLDQCLGPEGEILTLGVAPASRRQGIARLLLVDLIARARAAGAQRLALEVAADNAAALALYDSLGFVRHGLRRHYYRRARGPAADAWRLILQFPLNSVS